MDSLPLPASIHNGSPLIFSLQEPLSEKMQTSQDELLTASRRRLPACFFLYVGKGRPGDPPAGGAVSSLRAGVLGRAGVLPSGVWGPGWWKSREVREGRLSPWGLKARTAFQITLPGHEWILARCRHLQLPLFPTLFLCILEVV